MPEVVGLFSDSYPFGSLFHGMALTDQDLCLTQFMDDGLRGRSLPWHCTYIHNSLLLT